MSQDGKHNKWRKNQGYLETSIFFSALAFKQSADSFLFPYFLHCYQLPINMSGGMQNMMLKYYLLYSNNLKPQAETGLERITSQERPPVWREHCKRLKACKVKTVRS